MYKFFVETPGKKDPLTLRVQSLVIHSAMVGRDCAGPLTMQEETLNKILFPTSPFDTANNPLIRYNRYKDKIKHQVVQHQVLCL